MSVDQKLQAIYDDIKDVDSGNVATYIPQLANANADGFGFSLCFTDGTIKNYGDTTVTFSLQSCSKPLTYCVAREIYGLDHIHRAVGFEPSGVAFNAYALNNDGKPHNPMINAGAIMVASMIKPEDEPSCRYDLIQKYYCRMAGIKGKKTIGFDNSVFLSEQAHADRNISLTYFMREKEAFLKKTNHSILMNDLNLYFQCCSVTIDCNVGCVIAATLANGGVCPTTNEQVFSKETVRDCLSLMYNCGMYDYSGQFAFRVGLPAKSGVSGCILLVVPGQFGVCIYSPLLDDNGNSTRGVQVCERISKDLDVHLFHKMTQS